MVILYESVHAFLIYTFGLCNMYWNELHIVICAALSGCFDPAVGELNVAPLSSCMAQIVKQSFPVFYLLWTIV